MAILENYVCYPLKILVELGKILKLVVEYPFIIRKKTFPKKKFISQKTIKNIYIIFINWIENYT
jgi:hypothetical protein